MFFRMYVKLTDREAEALCRLAAQELRQPGDQARALLRKALAERGLLAPEPQPDTLLRFLSQERPS